MLRWFQIARLAYDHSPEKEQRLLAFASTPQDQDSESNPPEQAQAPGNDRMNSFPGDITLSARQKFHDAIFTATDLETQQKVVSEYLPMIKEKIGAVSEGNLSEKELQEVMELTRMSIVDDLNREETDRNQLALALGKIDTSEVSDAELTRLLTEHESLIKKYFTVSETLPSHQTINLLQALLAKDIERVRKQTHKPEVGITWNYLRADEFEKLYRKLRKVPVGEKVRMPNAFSHGRTMVFNIEHEDFKKDGIGETLAERAVFHEATHLALTNAEPKYGIATWANMLRSHPKWKELSAAVEEVFKQDAEYLKGGKGNERIASEALAIFMANKKAPIDPSRIEGNASMNAQAKVSRILDEVFANSQSGYFDVLRKQLETTVDRFTEVKTRNGSQGAPQSVGSMLKEASKETQTQQELLSDLDSKNPESEEVQTNTPNGVDIAQQNLADAAAETENLTAEQISAKIDALLTKLQILRERYPALQAIIEKQKMASDTKTQLLATVDQNLEFMDDSGTKLLSLKRRADILNRWNRPEAEGGLSVNEKSDFAEAEGFANHYRHLQTTVEAADALSAESCKNTLKEVQELMSVYEPIFKEMGEEIDKAEGDDKGSTEDAGGENATVAAWLKKNVFSSQGDVVWLTPLNIMHIIKTYKDAITQNYNSNQRVKENKVAKQINFYTPIQHTLNKLARSTNNSETSEFKEYIDREGFTFKEVFGDDGKGKSGGLLYQNRHNFNRAKAVLEYAADKAWMYFLDPLNGHNVYGIDYEAIEGHQSFEDLVQKHEAGKSHEIQHGYERIDKMPDVPPMIDTMVHELRQKNIFAVQGIMKRLQEKAKYSHSNTWMLTIILMLIRDESKKDPTLKLCLDKGMIDNISNITIERSAWSITWLKLNRHEIEKWKKGDEFGNNHTTRAMELIERKLEEAGAKYPDTKEGRLAKYEAIAMVLAGKTLYRGNKEAENRGLLKYGWNPGASISIFGSDEKLKKYRDAFQDATSNTETEPGSTDSDYFNPGNGGADIMLLDGSQVSRILSRKSTSEWTYDSKARGFITQVFMRYDELEQVNPDAFQVFKNEMRKKFDYCMDGVWDTSRRPTVIKDTDLQGNNMVDQLASRGLLSDSKIQELAKIKPDILQARRKIMKLQNDTLERGDPLP